MYISHTCYMPVNYEDTEMNKTNECPALGELTSLVGKRGIQNLCSHKQMNRLILANDKRNNVTKND